MFVQEEGHAPFLVLSRLPSGQSNSSWWPGIIPAIPALPAWECWSFTALGHEADAFLCSPSVACGAGFAARLFVTLSEMNEVANDSNYLANKSDFGQGEEVSSVTLLKPP